MTFGEKRKTARISKHYTQRQLAELINAKHNSISDWEKGNTEPSLSQLREMSRLSGVPMDFIFVPDKSN